MSGTFTVIFGLYLRKWNVSVFVCELQYIFLTCMVNNFFFKRNAKLKAKLLCKRTWIRYTRACVMAWLVNSVLDVPIITILSCEKHWGDNQIKKENTVLLSTMKRWCKVCLSSSVCVCAGVRARKHAQEKINIDKHSWFEQHDLRQCFDCYGVQRKEAVHLSGYTAP